MSGVTRQNGNMGDHDDEPLPESVQTDNDQPSTVSNLTAEFPSTPDTNHPILSRVEMGLSPTPPCRVFQMPKFARFEEEYDSDNQMGIVLFGGFEVGGTCQDERTRFRGRTLPHSSTSERLRNSRPLSADPRYRPKNEGYRTSRCSKGERNVYQGSQDRSSVEVVPGCGGRSHNSAKSTHY